MPSAAALCASDWIVIAEGRSTANNTLPFVSTHQRNAPTQARDHILIFGFEKIRQVRAKRPCHLGEGCQRGSLPGRSQLLER